MANLSDDAKQSIIDSFIQSQSSSSNSLVDVVKNQALSTVQNAVTSKVNSVSSVVSNEITSLTVHGTRSIKNQSDRRIKLRPKSGVNSFISSSILMKPLAATNGLLFPYTPRITVTHQATYGTQKTTHTNQDFRYYTNTPALSFNITGDFTAQTQAEAEYLLGVFHFISVLTKMHSGNSDSTDSALGLPPPMLLLSGFGPYVFNDLPVILTEGSYSYDPAVDLVEVTVNNVKNDVPSLCSVSLNVTVQNTPKKLRTFDWNRFASGQLLSSGGWK